MYLSDDEKAMLNGDRGLAKQKGMELLIRYGEAAGAQRLVDTNNVIAGVVAGVPPLWTSGVSAAEAAFSEFNLDSREAVPIPPMEVFASTVIQSMDPDYWQEQGVAVDRYERNVMTEAFCRRVGIQTSFTCTPYHIGNIPSKGQHCAWMESSAIPLCNGVFGARTNTEGCESAGSAMVTGKIPYWGYHLDENRLGTHVIEVEYDVQSLLDWGLLGYYAGAMVQEKVPVFTGFRQPPDINRMKHCSAAASSSGGVEMFHIVGVTPEAHTLEMALGKKRSVETLKFGKEERRRAYELLNDTKEPNVDFVMLGCPHYSIEQIWYVAKLLEGKRINANTGLWIHTPKSVKSLADRMGYTDIINQAGGRLMTDSCPCIAQVSPAGVKVAATDSVKQAHYMPSILGHTTWCGTVEECVQAALSGTWEGSYRD